MNNRPISYPPNLSNPYLNEGAGARKPPAAPAEGSEKTTNAKAAGNIPSPAKMPEATPQAAQAAAEGLSAAEQQMIDRYFPASSDLSMRLYGPGRNEQTINPGAVGRHLDVSG